MEINRFTLRESQIMSDDVAVHSIYYFSCQNDS